ncbi:MAG: (Fe-S)-binding protein [Candidatus Hermodarchaeota archaeon]
MDINKLLTQINSCVDCKDCMEVCDTYKVTFDEIKSPNGRLKIAKKVFSNNSIAENEVIGLYTCTLCGLCDLTCQQNIPISEIIHSSKIILVEKKQAPLEVHNKIIKGIVQKDNSVGGEPEDRLNWLPNKYKEEEQFENKNSDTLLFLGCMSSFRVKESALAPYEILKLAGYDFKILKEEPCCGEYVYSAGNIKLAMKIFKDNVENFNKIGVKNLIVTCGGCLYAFDKVYRKYFGDFNLKIKHIIEVIHDLEKKGKIKLNSLNRSITYHDPCRLGRKNKSGPLYTEPRELLKKSGLELKDLALNPEDTPCCGAGSGIRGVDSNICIKIGKELFSNIATKEIATSCPLCVFNFRYVNYKNQLDKDSKYITDYILESMKKKKN